MHKKYSEFDGNFVASKASLGKYGKFPRSLLSGEFQGRVLGECLPQPRLCKTNKS